MIYYSLVYPNILYGIIIWGNSLTSVHPLFILQKKVVRLIQNNYRNLQTVFYLPSLTARLILNPDQSIVIDAGPISVWYIDTNRVCTLTADVNGHAVNIRG